MAAEIRVDTIKSRSGINTLSFTGDGFAFLTNVGIGTTITTDPVDASNVSKLAVGIVTANYYYGDGSQLSNIISGVGIQSAGTLVGTGFTTLNFIGAGNTFAVNGTTIDISISGGGGGAEQTTTSGITTTEAVGIATFNAALYRSARARVQITQGSDYQISELHLVHDGTTASFVEPATIATGSLLGDFSVGIGTGAYELKVSMVSVSSATVEAYLERLAV